MSSPGEETLRAMRELDSACESRGLCWSVGRTRVATHECRVWRRRQSGAHPGPTLIEDGPTFEDAIRRALDRLGRPGWR